MHFTEIPIKIDKKTAYGRKSWKVSKTASELYFSRMKMVKWKEISVEKRAQIIILQKTGKNYREIAKILKISLCATGARTRFFATVNGSEM